jgi:protein-S-isoprenylcysteine O-methyltransferase Ste14
LAIIKKINKIISDEEFYLVKFFGESYIKYRENTGTLLFGMDYFLRRKR